MPMEEFTQQAAAGSRYPMSLRIHALLIAEIVALLQPPAGCFGRLGACQATEGQAAAGADRRTAAAVDRRACRRTEDGADGSAAHATAAGGSIRRLPADLRGGILLT